MCASHVRQSKWRTWELLEWSKRNQHPVIGCCHLYYLRKKCPFSKSSVILQYFWVKLRQKCPFLKIPDAALKFYITLCSHHFEERKVVSYDSFLVDNISRLIVPPILLTAPFPCEDAKKCHVILILHLLCNQDKVAAMYWFLNWLLGYYVMLLYMFSLSSSLTRCWRKTTQSLEWLWLPDTTTAKIQPTLCQRAAAKTVIWFLCQWADWTSSCQKME